MRVNLVPCWLLLEFSKIYSAWVFYKILEKIYKIIYLNIRSSILIQKEIRIQFFTIFILGRFSFKISLSGPGLSLKYIQLNLNHANTTEKDFVNLFKALVKATEVISEDETLTNMFYSSAIELLLQDKRAIDGDQRARKKGDSSKDNGGNHDPNPHHEASKLKISNISTNEISWL